MIAPAHIIVRASIGVGAINGAVHYIVSSVFDQATVRALIIAITTAGITGLFGVAIAKIQRDADKVQHERLDAIESQVSAVAGVVGANKRADDPVDGGKA